ncbi:hypothetical protein K9K77_02065 [Candidatus Babeliales bacterium]|nr:hypothetical protein [Candidatus Babeliales bacterium]
MKKNILGILLLIAGIMPNAQAATLKENVHSAGSSIASGVKKVGNALLDGLKAVGKATVSGAKKVYTKVTTKKNNTPGHTKEITGDKEILSLEKKISASTDINDNLQ